MKSIRLIVTSFLLVLAAGCDKKNDDLVKPGTGDNFPQVIKFDDEGDGDAEDADEFSFKLVLNDRYDATGENPGGKIIPLTEDVTVNFKITEWEGFDNPSDYIREVTGFYEIDDCTTSLDEGTDLNVVFDAATGTGSVRFPKGVEEIEIAFATDEDFFNDNTLNTEERSITLEITGLTTVAGQNVTFNKARQFKYEVLDDEAVHGDWEVDHEDSAQFVLFTRLFGHINEDIASLSADDVEKIEISIEYNEVKVLVELKEMEEIEECDGPEMVNKVIEIEADLEDLSTLTNEGDIEFAGEIEQEDGSVKEFVYKGGFAISSDGLTVTLTGEYDDEETDEIVLLLKK
ncbi:MAG: hypothetical protein EOO09_17650 [Chitinophagaceae bacterium]|nr:MAG: hypothetical protein EOO09_17650 [Chitinophagaceae bacterium]